MVGGTERLAAGAAAAVALATTMAIALGGGIGGVKVQDDAILASIPDEVDRQLRLACGCDPVETVVGGLDGLGDGARRVAETAVRQVTATGVEIGQAIHRAGPTGLVGSAPAIAGIAAGALLIAFWRLVTARDAGEGRDEGSDATEGSARAAAPSTGPASTTSPGAHPAGVPGSFRHVAPSADALIQQTKELETGGERSLLEVIAFMIVAEFGVLSSVTISAPTPEIGMGFFVLFLVGSTIFVRTPYRSYATALYHLAVGVVVAVGVSILLGHFWSQIPLEALLGQGYFATASMVAAVTGIAFSLLLGGR